MNGSPARSPCTRPRRCLPREVYNLFLSALEVRRLAAIPRGDVIQIVPVAEMPPERNVYVYKLKNAIAIDTAAVLTNVVARSVNPPPALGASTASAIRRIRVSCPDLCGQTHQLLNCHREPDRL